MRIGPMPRREGHKELRATHDGGDVSNGAVVMLQQVYKSSQDTLTPERATSKGEERVGQYERNVTRHGGNRNR